MKRKCYRVYSVSEMIRTERWHYYRIHMLMFFPFDSLTYHSPLSTFYLLFSHLFLLISLILPSISSSLNKRTVPQLFLVLKRVFIFLSNCSSPSDTRNEESSILNGHSEGSCTVPLPPGWGPCLWEHPWFLRESTKDRPPGAVERKLRVRDKQLWAQLCH